MKHDLYTALTPLQWAAAARNHAALAEQDGRHTGTAGQLLQTAERLDLVAHCADFAALTAREEAARLRNLAKDRRAGR